MVKTEYLRINILNLDGIEPSPENVVSGKYPLSRTLRFAYRKDLVTESMEKFLRFVFSKDGTEIMNKHGYAALSFPGDQNAAEEDKP